MPWRRRRNRERDLERELQAHLDLETEERGGNPYEARRMLGNTALIKEDVRAAWGGNSFERLASDLRYAVRTLRKSAGFTLTAGLSLALGIGATTAIFSVVHAVLLRPLPYPEPDRLVRLWEAKPAQALSRNVVNGWNFADWRARAHSLEDMAPMQEFTVNLTGRGEPVALPGSLVSSSFFSILRIAPLIGRTFTAAEETARGGRVLVLGYSLFQSRFGGDPKVIGTSVVVNGNPASIIGVMPAGFGLPDSRAQLWLPLRVDRSLIWERGRSLSVIARLKDGATVEQAGRDLAAVARQLAIERPGYDRDWTAEVIPMLQDTTQGVRTALLVLLGAVAFLLAIACANVANLFLIRGAARSREIALRETLGASKFRLFRQLLTESLLVSALAAALGVVLAYFGVRAMLVMLPASAALPHMETVRIDMPVFSLALAIVVLTALLFGLVPLLHTGRLDLQNVLRFRTRVASKGWRRAFVATQIALALVLLAGAGLMGRSFFRLISVNAGFTTDRVLAVDLFVSPVRFRERRGRSEYFDRLLTEIRATPGVQSASSIQFLPLGKSFSGSCFAPAEGPPPVPATAPSAEYSVVAARYFSTMAIPLTEGREFDERDRFGSADVVVVNRAFARQYYPNQNVIGKRIYLCWDVPDAIAEIVGVAEDARQRDLRKPPRPTIFVSNAQSPAFSGTLLIRGRESAGIARSVTAAVHRVNPDQALGEVRTMDEVRDASVAAPRLQLVLLLVFGGMALLLAAVGVYGVVSYSVAQRTHEIGIRVAVGASRTNIAALVLKEGFLLTLAGVVAGLASAFAVTRFLASLLFEVTPTDPSTLASVCGLLAIVAGAAASVPLRRALRVEPTTALRYE